ncbi:MAG TPA: CarD family transcriptional regulator, partial [Anaeromyxobacteraceae bacterium]|nr:CarD family transcriptional regulator [Anaeromyxobacteraceae bacterium]
YPDEPKEELPAVEGIIKDAAELKAGDRVIYPNQGVCVVVGLETKDIAGQKLELVRMRREEDGSAVLVPRGKVPSVGLRRVATGEQMEGVFHYLAAQFDDPELDWKVRHRENADRLIAGGVLGVAEVVKGLHSLSRIRPLPTKEREQYDNARHLLVHEVAVSLAVPPGLAEDYIDYALMPPEGVTFELKPPPKPVVLPSRPRRRRPVAEEETGELDLGLGELGIDLGDAAAVELPAVPEVEGVESTEEEGAESEREEEAAPAAPAAEEDEEAGELAPAPKVKKPPAKKAEKAAAAPAKKAEKPAKEPAAKKAAKPAKEPAAKKAAKPAKEPAAKKAPAAKKPAAKKAPAPKRGGKKK